MVALAQSVYVGGTRYDAGTDHTALPAGVADRIRNPLAWVGGTAPALSVTPVGKARIRSADWASATAARAALGLGNAATKNTGSAAGTVMAGDDSRAGLDPDTFTGTDFAKVQAAMNYAIANNFPAIVFRRQFDITGAGPLMVQKTGYADRRVIWLIGHGGGITKTDAGAMLSSSILNMGDISVRNMRFRSTAGAGTIVFDCDKLIRLSSMGSEYDRIDWVALATGSTVTNRFQSLSFIGDHIVAGNGPAFQAPRTFDVTIAYCLVEDRTGGLFDNVYDIAALQNNSLRINGNVVENCLGTVGTPIRVGACWSGEITGNYFESNFISTLTPYLDMHSLCGTVGHYATRVENNHFTLSTYQKANNGCAVAVGRTLTGIVSSANIAEGVLYDMKPATGGVTPLGTIIALGGDHSTKRVLLREYYSSHYQSPNITHALPGGVTASRPATPRLRQEFFDDTLGKPIWCKTVGTRPQQSIVISAGATASGNITVQLYLADPLVVAVAAGDTITQVRDKIAASVVLGYVTGTLSTNRVLFTRDTPQVPTLPTFDPGTTGVTQSSITLDVAAVLPTWVDATGVVV